MFIRQNLSNLEKLSYQKMISNKKIAVVGGGISSLSLVLNMARKMNLKENNLTVRVFERK